MDFDRYHRQMLLPGFGEAGQRRLRESTVLLLGCGALGSVAAELLARAGVGELIIVDRDFVELTNLQRQLMFDERDVADAMPKAEAAKRRLAAINSQVAVTAIVDDLNHTNIERYAAGADVFVDGLDNFETRYLANDLAVSSGRAYVYGAAVGTTGMACAFLPRSGGHAAWEAGGGNFATPCFRCLFDEAPPAGTGPTCDTVGVISTAVGIVANFQVTETLKILTGNFERVSRTLLNIDLWANEIMQLAIAFEGKDECPCCELRRFPYLDGQAGSSAATLCGRNAVQLRDRQQAGAIDLAVIEARLSHHGRVQCNDFMLQAAISDDADPQKEYEISVFRDGRAIVKGTGDIAQARSIFAKYVGN